MIKKVGMTVRYNLISYLIGDGIRNIGKNKKSTMSAIIIMVVTMITVGICFVIGENVKAILKNMENGYSIQVYIDNHATQAQKNQLKKELSEIEYVNPDNIHFVDKKEAYQQAVKRLGESTVVGYTETDNPFPESYIITLTQLDKLEEVLPKIEALANVKDTSETGNDNKKSGGSETKSPAEKLTHFNRSTSICLVVVGGVLIAFSIIIIGNTIKLTVHARRKEISIMKYVGATNNFIRAPFIVEGIILGIISTLISVLLLGGIYIWLKNGLIGDMLQGWLKEFSNMSSGMENLLEFNQMFSQIMMIFLGIGIGIGVFGSVLSMKKYLKV
jgi:cell division transport system permease protein